MIITWRGLAKCHKERYKHTGVWVQNSDIITEITTTNLNYLM